MLDSINDTVKIIITYRYVKGKERLNRMSEI